MLCVMGPGLKLNAVCLNGYLSNMLTVVCYSLTASHQRDCCVVLRAAGVLYLSD